MLASAALVMFMTPGLALFYGGLVRAKNVLGTIMQSFIALGLVTVLWALFGYSLAFGPDAGRLIGNLSLAGLHGVGAIPSAYAPTVPATTFMVFQLMFAIITPALIAGAFADRMKFSGYLVFIGLWSLFVYAPVGAATGAVAGLATITPAAGFVEPWAALLIGFAAGAVCYFAVAAKARFGYDDSLDVVGVHMVGGVLGVLATGAFASLAINAA